MMMLFVIYVNPLYLVYRYIHVHVLRISSFFEFGMVYETMTVSNSYSNEWVCLEKFFYVKISGSTFYFNMFKCLYLEFNGTNSLLLPHISLSVLIKRVLVSSTTLSFSLVDTYYSEYTSHISDILQKTQKSIHYTCLNEKSHVRGNFCHVLYITLKRGGGL